MNFSQVLSVSKFFIVISILICIFIQMGTAGQNEEMDSKTSDVQSHLEDPSSGSLQVSEEHAPDRLIVRYDPNQLRTESAMMSAQSATNAEVGSSVIADFGPRGIPGMQIVQVKSTTLDSAMKAYTRQVLMSCMLNPITRSL